MNNSLDLSEIVVLLHSIFPHTNFKVGFVTGLQSDLPPRLFLSLTCGDLTSLLLKASMGDHLASTTGQG